MSREDTALSPGTLTELRDEINARIDRLLPADDQPPQNLHRAMRYSLKGSGKRIRPLLCLLISEAANADNRSFALDAGCATELVHTASLVLDDLPCMDDASLRRGRPATHCEFGQATAILAAIGLLNRAFGILAEHEAAKPRLRAEAAKVLSDAIGSNGMIAGQEIDLHERASFETASRIEGVNWLKTGTLFVASAHLGALAAQLPPPSVEAIRDFAKHVGLAFQTADDLIDQIGDVESAGKDVRQDTGTPTLVSLTGPQGAARSCRQHLEIARAALDRSGLETVKLLALVDSIFGSRA